jgi:hypothetical protein
MLERWRPQDTSQRVGRFRVDRRKKALVRTYKQPIDCAAVLRSRAPGEAMVSAIKALYLELLARYGTIHLAEFRRQYDLALGRNGGLHKGKMSS